MSSTFATDAAAAAGASRPTPRTSFAARMRAQSLTPAVLLDAAMPAWQALERLAEHHVWFAADHPVIQRLVARQAGDFGLDPADVARDLADRYALAVGARVPAAGESAAVSHPPERVVVRRVDGVTIYWYHRDPREVLRALFHAFDRGGPDTSVLDALNLHEHGSVPSVQLDAFIGGEQWGDVVLRGSTLVGVARPMAMAGPPDDGPVRGGPTVPPPPRAESPPIVGAAPGGRTRRTRGAPTPPAPSAPPAVVIAYPHVDAPAQVVAGETVTVALGLASAPTAGVAGGPLGLPVAEGQRTFDVEARVSADGFDAPDGWVRRFEVPIGALDSVRVTLPLVARVPAQPGIGVATLLVHFAVDGVLRGSASRALVVLPGPGAAVPAPDPRGVSRIEDPTPRAFDIAAPAVRTDIEILIAKPDRNPATGCFSLALRTPHPVAVPDTLPGIDLGADAATFAKTIIEQVRQHDGKPLVANLLAGIGVRIARQLPAAFWEAFDRVARHVRDTERRAPTVLLLASENLVPWELAALPTPLDPTRPPFLAAQTSMGRWILDEGAVPLPPPDRVEVRGMAVLAGHYEAETGLEPLPHAVEEATALGERHRAIVKLASQATLSALLDAQLEDGLRRVGVEIVHFSGHGEIDPRNSGVGGIYLEDGSPINPLLFTSSTLGTRHKPFIFLNACMVGMGGQMLGDCSGFPGECLGGGFRGLVAPLWAVRDTLAKEIALDFYAAVLSTDAAPRPVGDVLREIRGRYAAAGKTPQPTYLAYVLYGHPGLSLVRAQ